MAMGVIARQSIKGALANYAGVVLGFVITFFVLTDCLSQAEIGLTRVMVDAALLFSQLAQLGSNASIVRFFPYFKDDDRNHGIFGWSLLLPAVGFVLFLALFFGFREQLMAVYAQQAPMLVDYFYLLPMLTFFALYTSVFETNASVLMRITVPKLVREVGIRLANLAAYLLYGHGVVGIDGFVWLFCGSYGLAMLLDMGYLLSLGRISFRIDRQFVTRDKLREIVRYSLFMTLAALVGAVPLLNSLFLGAKEGLAVAGVYTIAYYIANIVEIPYRSLGSISRPVVAARVKEGDMEGVNSLVRQVSLHQLIVSSMIFFLIWINLRPLFGVIPNGSQYAGGAMVVFFLGLARILNSSLSIATDVLTYSRYYTRTVFFILIITASALWLNGALIDLWGLNGSALATLFSYAAYFAALLFYVWRRLGVGLFSLAQLKVVAVMAAAFGLNSLWEALPFGTGGSLWALVADSAARTLLLGGGAAAALYALRVSPTLNGIADRLLARLKK